MSLSEALLTTALILYRI